MLPFRCRSPILLFELEDLSSAIDITRWARFYDAIPVDPYVKEGYRYKAVAWLRVKHAHAPVDAAIDEHIARANEASGMSAAASRAVQSGGPPTWISREVLDGPDFQRLWLHYATKFGWGDAIVLVQFQRVDCRPDRVGRAAVEGFHRDGNLHVAMLFVDRVNLTAESGVSQYKLDRQGTMTDALVLDAVVPPGTLIQWNDERVWHYGTDLVVADARANGGRGTRDVVILSAKQPPAHVPMAPVPERFRDRSNE